MIRCLASLVNSPVGNINHPLRIRIPKVTLMRRSQMDHAFIDRIARLVRENARRQARNNLFAFVILGALQNVVGHQHVVTVKIRFVAHVGKETADFGCQVNDVCWAVFGEDGLDVLEFPTKRQVQ